MTDEQEHPRAPSAILEEGRRWGAGTWAFLAAGIVALVALLAALTLWGFSSQATVDRLRAQVAREQGEYDALSARYDDLWQQYQRLYDQAIGGGLEPDTPDPAEVPDAADAVPNAQRGPKGDRGEPGRAPTFPELFSAVEVYCGPPSTACEGKPGADGADGLDGAPGAPGADGADGANGLDGSPGATGATGATGMPGERGLPGRDGVDGKDGAPGPQGPPGPPGPACPTGSTPTTMYVLGASDPLAAPTMQQATLCVVTTTGGTP